MDIWDLRDAALKNSQASEADLKTFSGAISKIAEWNPSRESLTHYDKLFDPFSMAFLGRCGCSDMLCEKLRNKFYFGIE